VPVAVRASRDGSRNRCDVLRWAWSADAARRPSASDTYGLATTVNAAPRHDISRDIPGWGELKSRHCVNPAQYPEKKKSLQDLREAMMASLASVTREQFKIRSELEVVHIPTGAVFRAHPYSNPDDMLESVKVNWGRAGVPPEGDCADQVQRMASQLLLERAARDRRLGMRLENIWFRREW
jgi:hypothetical protein